MSVSFLPEWTEVSTKNGLDPLGMQASCVRLYQRLMPGVSNVTNSLRYYGFYAWLTKAYAERHGRPDIPTWRRFLRRAEALYAVTAVREQNVVGVAGYNWASETLNALHENDVLDFARAADQGAGERQYLKQAFGAYGAAYGGQLFEVSILADSEGHSVPVPSAGLGEQFATLFSEAIGEAQEAFFLAVDRGTILVRELDHLIPMSPNQIRSDSAECEAYRSMLFAESSSRPSDLSRKISLRVLLRLSEQLGRSPDGANEVRWCIYDGATGNGQSVSFDDPEDREQIALHAKSFTVRSRPGDGYVAPPYGSVAECAC